MMKLLNNVESSIINVDNDNGRVFEYTLNKKKAKAKLLKGANRENHLDVEFKSGCANLRFSNGSYLKLILPLLKNWNENKEKIVQIDDSEVHIVEVEAGRESLGQHMDTKLVVMVNGDRLVLHVYNGTQNLMVQGKNYQRFASDCLEPYFRREIGNNIENITNFNTEVKNILGEKKSIKRSEKPFKCPQCGVKASKIGDLKLHMKRCHTKPGIDSPSRKKSIRILQEDVSILDVSGVKSIEYINDERKENLIDNRNVTKFLPESENLITCDFCEKDMIDQSTLIKHRNTVHNQGDSIECTDQVIGALDDKNILMITLPQSHSISICGDCGLGFENEEECNEHICLVSMVEIVVMNWMGGVRKTPIF